MKRFLFSSFLILLFIPGILTAQRDSSRNTYLDAESWLLFEEYADAYLLYKKLLDENPGNDNLKYKIGICLLNDPYRKDQSIAYLLDASKNINPEYKENSYKEETAPPDVLYYLGEAYLVNELLEMAISAYEEFLEIMNQDIYDAELVEAQIRACKNAQRLKTMPVDIDLEILGTTVNTRYPDINPVVSGDGTKLAFVTEQPFFDEALFCELTDSGWSYPMSITSMLGFDADIYPVGLSYDGTEMILYYDDDYIGNLYYSRLEDGFWIPAVKLGENISTKYWESHACFSSDGKTIYFTSNRKGTHGGLDIYKSSRGPGGSWGVPENLGPTINSRYNEETPFITEDGNTLYFSSYGHYNMGGYDVFYSKKKADGTWAEPVNMGYPINTTDDDLFFLPVNNGYAGYYSRYTNQGVGEHDIYYMDVYSVDNPRMYMVSGNVRTEDGSMDPGQIAIFVVDSKTGDTIMIASPDRETGEFSVELEQGLYALHFSGPGYEELIRPLSITTGSNKKGIKLEDEIALSLLKEEPRVFEGEESLIQLKDSIYEAEAGESIKIPLRLEKGSTLIARLIQDSTVVSEDTVEVEKRRIDYEIITLFGTSEVELVMIDSEKNLHKRNFTVIGKEPEKTADDRRSKAAANREIDQLMKQLPAGVDVEQLHQEMLGNADGPLKEYLEGLDLEKEEIQTPGELLDHLKKASDREGFSTKQVMETLETSVAQLEEIDEGTAEDPTASLKAELINKSDGSLKEELQSLDSSEEEILTGRELFEHLYNESKDYSAVEVDMLLSEAIAGKDTEMLYQQLLENSDGALKEYLKQLDLDKEGISSTGELLDHLQEVAKREGFTIEQVREAMLRSLDHQRGEDPASRLIKALSGQAEGSLGEMLKTLDTGVEGIHTERDLFEHLYGQSESEDYSVGEVDGLLSETLSGGDADLLYQRLLENSDGALREYLENLDLEKEGITSPAELLRHLEDVAGEKGFTMEQVREAMLISLDQPLEVDDIYEELIKTAADPIREILMKTDLRTEGICSVEDLISHLYRELEEQGYSPAEIEKMLSDLFGSHTEFIEQLGKKGLGKGGLIAIIGLAVVGLILFIFLWRKRRENSE